MRVCGDAKNALTWTKVSLKCEYIPNRIAWWFSLALDRQSGFEIFGTTILLIDDVVAIHYLRNKVVTLT